MRVHRHLSLSTFDLRLHTLLTRERKTLANSVQHWYAKNRDQGASMYFRLTRTDPGLPNFVDRWSLCDYICSMSPKLRYLCKIIGSALFGPKETRGKLLVFVTWPIEQWLVGCLLSNLGIDHLAVTAGMSAAEKAKTTDRFDDIDDPCPILVCTFRSTAFGVNLQRGCSKLVMTGMPENINTLLQTIGRIHRLGQQRIQEVWILGTDHTYDQILQASAVKKMVIQMLGESEVTQLRTGQGYKDRLREAHGLDDDEEVDQMLAEVKGSHLLEQVDGQLVRLLGMRCSRLSWDQKDLYAKDDHPETYTPRRVRTQKEPQTPGAGPSGDGMLETTVSTLDTSMLVLTI
jgi:superfamily II DNA/RNA helicase